VSRKPPIFETTPCSHTKFGLYCGGWGVDWTSRQAYNVSVVIVSYERWEWAWGKLAKNLTNMALSGQKGI